ncbi:uncharacterized protein F4822DRAFT_395364 [Hypoxylon trugodes]|uniref:uncharacterized protein n=1 Tax=Hypoxylon trugodes TaxID=326681 RepID=UPI00218F81BA|nr:uncharacterized protein F4822DRAFT_395364 [Hypoxylon trugodes]KAI1391071.1 hypothetical protein F4822DRAFT_395364 [Hypoxylon trugodes]
MESLRQQLSDTQGALTSKIFQTRELKAAHNEALNTWRQEKQTFEAEIQRLKDEIQQLRQGNRYNPGASVESLHTKDGLQDANGSSSLILMGSKVGLSPGTQQGNEETITITRSRMQEVESKYRNVTDELAAKTKLCETLQQQLQAQDGNRIGASYPSDLSDSIVIGRWETLRNQIRTISLEKFNETIQPRLVPEKARREFDYLSTHWKSYLTSKNLASYLFRALIWRYVYTTLFSRHFRVWGKPIDNVAEKLESMFAAKASETEILNWRTQTTRIFHQSFQTDPNVATDAANKIFDATSQFATSADEDALKRSIQEIATTAVDLSSMFDRSRLLVLMSNKPGSQLTHGFPYQEATMEMKGKLSGQLVVDMVVSPCLLKKEEDYSVLVKAEVMC